MKKCKNCGAELADEIKFCTSCGEEQKNEENQNKYDFSDKFSEFNNTVDHTEECEKKDIEDNKVLAVLSYFSWLVLFPIFAARNSKFARFHANQGLVLAIAETIYMVATNIVVGLLVLISPLLGFIGNLLALPYIFFLALMVIGIVNAVSGHAKELPVIGKIVIIK